MDRRTFLTHGRTTERDYRTAAGTSSFADTAPPPAGDVAQLHRRVLSERMESLKGRREPYDMPRMVTSGLEPWHPSTMQPWSRQRAGYLLRRTLFGTTLDEIETAMASDPDEVVHLLVTDTTPPEPPFDWQHDDYWNNNTNNDRDNRDRLQELRDWWTERMLLQDFSIREKMTFFWSNHWATEASSARQPHFNFWFIEYFRQNFLGNFKQMVKDVTVSPLMLLYLDGAYNTRTRPNENYARELMELHTLGEGNGYTQEDIQEAARALTGWTLQQTGTSPVGTRMYHPREAVFVPGRFDNNEKTIMGRTGNWGYADVVDIIFDVHGPEVARFICRKLYREFVYEIADEQIIDGLADILMENNWELRPVMMTLLKSRHFFDAANIGAHITSPLEFYIGSMRALHVEANNVRRVYQVCASLGCQLLEAPNVKGWPGYRSWISASRLASRWSVSDELVFGTKSGNPRYGVDVTAFIGTLPNPRNARRLVHDVVEFYIPLRLSNKQFDMLLDALLGGAPEYEWDPTATGAENHIKDFLKAVLRLSEAQLS
ncbi:MAG: DUF1800 domain-containing protein [Bacteroidetes bacterium]|nr:DUF1800 domain-containing protein [Bacteroidota bacterium]